MLVLHSTGLLEIITPKQIASLTSYDFIFEALFSAAPYRNGISHRNLQLQLRLSLAVELIAKLYTLSQINTKF